MRRFYALSSDCDYLLDMLFEKVPDLYGVTRSIELEPVDMFKLDPGGALCAAEKYKTIMVHGLLFEVQLSMISWVIDRMERSDKKTAPGLSVAKLYDTDICFLALPNQIMSDLISELEKINCSDAVLHAKITRSEHLLAAEEISGGVLFFGEMHPDKC